MAGIYIHVPFCKTKCSYCDFYKTEDISLIENFTNAIKLEIWKKRDYLENDTVDTIYFGGGTPSLLNYSLFIELLSTLHSIFEISENAEITIEANPDDLNPLYLDMLRKVGFNRISIGIQSLNQGILSFMNRRHNVDQAKSSVSMAKNAGFENISIDLIYGVPNLTLDSWQNDLNNVLAWDVQHISAYHLTYHKGTRIWNDLKKRKIYEVEENDSVLQFEMLKNQLKNEGYIHYEISNFAIEGYYSRHNTAYWSQKKYLGLGPSAHSFNNFSRQWNISNLNKYLSALSKGNNYYKIEKLTADDSFNDYLITSLRTIWGIDLNFVENKFGHIYLDHLKNKSQKYLDSGQIRIKNSILYLNSSAMFVSDSILTDLLFLR